MRRLDVNQQKTKTKQTNKQTKYYSLAIKFSLASLAV